MSAQRRHLSICSKNAQRASSLALLAFTLSLTPIAARSQPAHLTGVNISGAEFNGRKVPGIPGTDYFYPARATIDYVASKGLNTIRVPFLWERMQPQLNGPLDVAELKRLDSVVQYATGKGLYVVLDAHNYGYYRQQVIGSAAVPTDALAGLWQRLAEQYKSNTKVGFGLMNEPKGLPTETWLDAANRTIAAIRQVGAQNTVFVPGNAWTGAHSWASTSYGTSNATAMKNIVDSANNYVYELHQYLDSNYSGTHPDCKNETVGVTTLTGVTNWLRQNNKKGYLGEFGAGSDPTCLAALDAMLKYMGDNRDVWMGWTYWAAGAWPPSYFTSVQPVNGQDRPQMAVLLRHLSAPAENTGSGAR